LNKLKGILIGDVPINLTLQFLHSHNRWDYWFEFLVIFDWINFKLLGTCILESIWRLWTFVVSNLSKRKLKVQCSSMIWFVVSRCMSIFNGSKF
jgi:hypothetical protein